MQDVSIFEMNSGFVKNICLTMLKHVMVVSELFEIYVHVI